MANNQVSEKTQAEWDAKSMEKLFGDAYWKFIRPRQSAYEAIQDKDLDALHEKVDFVFAMVKTMHDDIFGLVWAHIQKRNRKR